MQRFLIATFAFTAAAGCTGPAGSNGENGVDGVDGSAVVTIDADTTWSADQTLDALVYVQPGVTLTIDAGVQVGLLPGAGLLVDGVLDLEGDQAAPVRFAPASTVSTGELGVLVGGTGDASDLSFAVFDGVNLSLEGGATAGITGASFADATLTVTERDAAFAVAGCSFADNLRNNGSALVVRDVPRLDVTDTAFREFGFGLQYDGLADGAELNVTNASFEEGTLAVRVGFVGTATHSANLVNVSITDMVSQGISVFNTAATITDSTIANTLSLGITGDRASQLTIRDTSVTNADSTCISARGDGATLERVTVSRCTIDGIEAGNGATLIDTQVSDVGVIGVDLVDNATVNGVTVTNAAVIGIQAEAAASASNVTVTGAGTICLDLNGDGGAVDGANVSDCGFDGVEVGNSTSVANVVANEIGDDCIDGGAGLAVAGSTLTGCGGNGVDGDGGIIDTTSIADTGSHAVFFLGGDLVITDTDITNAGNVGIFTSFGTLTATNVSVTGTVGNGIFADRPTVMDRVTVTAAGVDGMDLRGETNVLVNTVVDGSSDDGIFALGQISISSCAIVNNGADGIFANSTTGSSSVRNCDVIGNGRHGVRQNATPALSLLDVRDSNLVGNAGFAVFDARLVDGNFTADNNGLVGVDLGTGGALDGTRGTNTQQINDADAISNPQSATRTDTGPLPPG